MEIPEGFLSVLRCSWLTLGEDEQHAPLPRRVTCGCCNNLQFPKDLEFAGSMLPNNDYSSSSSSTTMGNVQGVTSSSESSSAQDLSSSCTSDDSADAVRPSRVRPPRSAPTKISVAPTSTSASSAARVRLAASSLSSYKGPVRVLATPLKYTYLVKFRFLFYVLYILVNLFKLRSKCGPFHFRDITPQVYITVLRYTQPFGKIRVPLWEKSVKIKRV